MDESNQLQMPEDDLDCLLRDAAWPAWDEPRTRRVAATLSRQRWFVFARVLTTTAAAVLTIGVLVGLRLILVRKASPSTPIAIGPPPGLVAAVRPTSHASTPEERLMVLSLRSHGKQTAVVIPTMHAVPLKTSNQIVLDVLAGRFGEDAGKAAAQWISEATSTDWPLVRACLLRPELQPEGLTALAARHDDVGVGLLLQAVLDPHLRQMTLAATQASHGGAVEALIEQFNSPLIEQRLAAAWVLGRSGDGATLDRLATMAESGLHRREALAALIAGHSSAANQRLIRVSRSSAVLPHVVAVRQAVEALFPS